MPPKFELGRDFSTVHLIAKFHHPTFNRSEVKRTDKQTDAAVCGVHNVGRQER